MAIHNIRSHGFTPGNIIHKGAKNVESSLFSTCVELIDICSDLKHLLDEPKANGIDIRAELIAFHKKYYSASIMTGCIVGRESLVRKEICKF